MNVVFRTFFLLIGVLFVGAGSLRCARAEKKASGVLHWLYEHRVGKRVRSVLVRPWFSKLSGVYMNSLLSRPLIRKFVREHDIDMSEAERPLGKYKNFNDFFTRKLKPGSRSIDYDPQVIVSPADGDVSVVHNLSEATAFSVKGLSLDLRTFVGDAGLAREYYGGTLVIVRLSPWHYHRFHFPVDSVATKPLVLSGKFESVNPCAYQACVQPLEINERHLIKLEHEHCGTIIMIPVGALCVGRIKETFTPEKPSLKGDEMGYFEFGGSTVVLVFKPGVIELDAQFTDATLECEVPVKMGQLLGMCKKSDKATSQNE